jgi:UDP-glucuronate decarboxylase
LKKVLITGAAGFLGSHLAKALVATGVHVIGLDNFSTGRIDNIKSLADLDYFTFIECDVTVPDLLGLPKLNGVDEIYHMASPASPRFYQAQPFQTIAVNTVGTKLMLDLALRNDAKLVYTSTSEAYGDPEVHPQHEEYRGNVNTWGPRACYDEAKRLGEVYCYEYAHRYGLSVKVARIFNTYSAGLRNDDGRVVSNFVTQALTQQDITVYGDGSQTRSFCYVDDTVRGLQLMMDCDLASGQLINIGSPVETTILEVAHLVKSMTKSSSRITYSPLPKDDPKVRRPVIDKARRILGWEPSIDLQEGLSRMIQTYKEQLSK